MSSTRISRHRRVGTPFVQLRLAAAMCEVLEARQLLCAEHAMQYEEEPGVVVEPQVFTAEQLAAAADLDAQHAAEVDAYLAAKADGKLGAAGEVGGQTLGNIVWTNRNDSGNGFADAFGGATSMAKLVVDAAVDAWDKVIADFNWPSRDNNLAFEVHIDVNGDPGCGGYADTGNDNGGIPYDGDFVLKRGTNCSNGAGWWLDPTPTENSEFRGNITQAFSMDALNGSPAKNRADLFTVVVAEMAHLLGMSDDQDFPFDDAADQAPNAPFVDTNVTDDAFGIGTLWTYHYNSNSVSVLFTSNNGGVTGSDFNGPIHTADPSDGNKLLRGGIWHYGIQDAGNAIFESSRRYLPSLLLARMFNEVFPYSIVYPQHDGSAYADLSSTGNLLIRGGATSGNIYSSLVDSSDYIALSQSGSQLKVDVAIGNDVPGSGANMTLSHYFDIADISSIDIAAGDGNDLVFINYLPAGVDVNVNLGDRNDTISIGGGDFDTNILSDVNVNGSLGVDSLQMDDSDDTGADGYSLTNQGIGKTSVAITANANQSIEKLYLTANNAGNTITVWGAISYQVDIHAGGGNDTIVNNGTSLFPIFDDVTIYGDDGTDTVHMNDSTAAASRTWTIGSVSTGTPEFGPWLYFTTEALIIDGADFTNVYNIVSLASTQTLTINGGDDDDSFTVGATNRDLTVIDGDIILAGGLGVDSLHIDDRDGPSGGIVGAIYNLTKTTFQSVVAGMVTFSSMSNLTIDGNAFGDLFNVDGTLASTATTINGNGDNDIFDITDGDVDSAIDGTPTVNGGSGDDEIRYNDQNDTLDDSYNITRTNITKLTGRTVIADLAYTSIVAIDLNASPANSFISVDSLGTFNFPLANLTTDVNIDAGDGDDHIFIGDGTMIDMYGDVTVAGGAGTDVLTVDDSAATTGHNWIVTNTSVDRNPGTLTTYGTVESLIVKSGDSNDTIDIPSDSIPTTVNGGDGDDIITLAAGNLGATFFPVAINGEAGIDSITLNDSIYAFSTNHTITPSTVTRSLFSGLTYGTAESLTLQAPGTAGTVNVNGTAPLTPVTIFPNNGTDTIDVIETSPTAPVLIKASSGNDLVRVNQSGAGAARAQFDSTIVLGELTIGGGGFAQLLPAGDRVLRTPLLALSGDATLDLNDNDMIVDNANAAAALATLATITQQIGSARNSGGGGIWTGAGITSSAARNYPSGLTGLGVVRNTDDGVSVLHSTFSGQFVFQNAVLVKHTWNGDTDLTGVMDADDYFKIDSGFATGLSSWRDGDVDYSATIDADDYFLADNAFAGQSGVLAAPLAAAADPAAKPRARKLRHRLLP